MEETSKRRDDIMRKVQALLAKADSTTFGEERDAFLAKADQLMMAYQIEAFELEFRKDKTQRRKPELRIYEYGTTGSREADDQMVQVFKALADMIGIKLGFWGWRTSKAVGYPEDLDYLDMLFTNIRLHLALKLEPKADPKLTIGENAAMLKEAGLTWERIHEQLFKVGLITDPDTRPVRIRIYNHYKKFLKEDGDRKQVYANPDVWRRNFILGYTSELTNRIYEMSNERRKAAQGHELVLASMKDDLLEALYEHFPHLRPHAPDCNCDECHRCGKPTCQRPNCVAARKPVRYSSRARTVRELKYDASAASAGASAARTMDLGSARGAPAPKNKELS